MLTNRSNNWSDIYSLFLLFSSLFLLSFTDRLLSSFACRSALAAFGQCLEQELQLLILNLHLTSNLDWAEFHLIMQRIKSIERKPVLHKLCNLVQIEFGTFFDDSINALVHLLLSRWLLESHSAKHVFNIFNVRQLLVKCIHLALDLWKLLERHGLVLLLQVFV